MSIIRAKLAKPPRPDQPILSFVNAAAFQRWLHEHHLEHPGIWLRIFKKASGEATVSYLEAVDEALCYGWIDGQKQRHDERSWLQKFTRRGPRSVWSKVNTGHVERLIRENRMQPAGLAAVLAAQADGRWAQAYSSSSTATMPEDFLQALEARPRAKEFFATLAKSSRYSIYFHLQSAKKPETRARRLKKFLIMLVRRQKP